MNNSGIYYRVLSKLRDRFELLRGRAVVACQAHNLKVIGSIPIPATIKIPGIYKS